MILSKYKNLTETDFHRFVTVEKEDLAEMIYIIDLAIIESKIHNSNISDDPRVSGPCNCKLCHTIRNSKII